MFNITDVTRLQELVVAQAGELVELKASYAHERVMASMWLDLEIKARKSLEELQAKFDGLEELYAQRGDRIRELEGQE